MFLTVLIFLTILGEKMKKLIIIVMLGLSSIGFSGPVVEVYECQINKGTTLEDLSNMMDTFSTYLKKAGL